MKFIHGILLNIPYIYPMVSIIYLNIHGIKISHGRWRPPTPAPPWGEEMSRKVIKRQFTKEATNLKKRLSEVFLRYKYKIQNIRYIRYNYTYVSYNLFGGCKIQLSYLYIYIHMVRPPFKQGYGWAWQSPKDKKILLRDIICQLISKKRNWLTKQK